MKNIFKENKKLKEEIRIKDLHINQLERENTEGIERLRNYYDTITERKIDYIKQDYNTKIERKKEVTEIAKLFEKRIKEELESSFLDLDLTNEIENYLKILKYLKEN